MRYLLGPWVLCGGILTSLLAFGASSDISVLKRKAGQLMWVGYHNLDQISDIQPSGVVFFGWNTQSAVELQKNVMAIRRQEKALGLIRSLTAIDHEGGKVMRLKRGLSYVPDAAALAATRDSELVQNVSFLMARELRNIGVDINFAPVMDRGDARSFLENRIWGNTADIVTQMTGAFIEGHLKGGTFPFAKHFPGHGPHAFQDAHFLKAVNHQSKADLIRDDLPPFLQAMQDQRTPALMTAHVEISSLDRKPASLSKRILSDFIRKELGFSGFILSDDLEMGAANTQSIDTASLALQSLKSGVDSVMIVWSQKEQRRVRDRIVKALQTGELSEAEVDQKIARVQALREKVLGLKVSSQTNPSIAYQQKKTLIEQAWVNSQSWILGNELQTLNELNPKSSLSWTVVVPRGPYAKIWKTFRPRDQIYAVDVKSGIYTKTLSLLKKKSNESNPIVVLTLPLHQDGGEWVKHLAQFFNQSYKANQVTSPVLWVHMGMLPVNVSRVEKPQKPFSLVLLNSSTPIGLRHFMRVLGSDRKALSSVSQHVSPLYAPLGKGL